MIRCCNIDWLEVHVLEDATLYPLDANYFRSKGLFVREREYGTRVYEQMFTILDSHDEPFIEVRRKPKSSQDLHGVLDPYSAHIRLSNRYCYVDNPARIMRDFLAEHHYIFRRIFRIDLCLDFERFDLGDDPAKFIKRYLSHKFAKINQCNRTTRGRDRWDGCDDNYISWGAKKSMVSTKLYNKSLELQEVKYKPYIVWSWYKAGLIDDPINRTKTDSHGIKRTPVIWRVEFSVQSGAAGWAILEDCTGAKNRKKPIENNLSCYDTAEKILQMFASLAHHYFHFKHFEKDKRKDRCRDKVLFNFNFTNDEVLRLQRVPGSEQPATDDIRLKRHLERYRDQHFDKNVRKACDILLTDIDRSVVRTFMQPGYTNEQYNELAELLRRRLICPEEDFQVAVKTVHDLFTQKDAIF